MSRLGQAARRVHSRLGFAARALVIFECCTPGQAPLFAANPMAQSGTPLAGQFFLVQASPVINPRQASRSLAPLLGSAPRSSSADRVVFESGPGVNAEDYCRVVVSGRDGELLFQMVAGGNFGLNVAREFFESPFFTRSETEQLYGLFSRARAGARQRVGRYEVGMKLATRAERFELTMRFVRHG